MRQDIRSQRKKIVAANLPLTEAEAVKFCPVFDRYVVEHSKIYDTRYALIKEYAQNYDKMTTEQANGFMRGWTAIEEQMAELRLKRMPEFEKVIPPKNPRCSIRSTGASAIWSNCNCYPRFLWLSHSTIRTKAFPHALRSRGAI